MRKRCRENRLRTGKVPVACIMRWAVMQWSDAPAGFRSMPLADGQPARIDAARALFAKFAAGLKAMEGHRTAMAEAGYPAGMAARGTGEVSSNILGVNQTASETGSVAGQVLHAAGDLAREAERLRQEVQNFVATIRAA